MRTIGLIGGMSWESTQSYYRLLNEGVKARLGGLHSARIALYSVDFHDIEPLMRTGEWNQIGQALAEAGRAVEAAGADFMLLCTNTMHKVTDPIEQACRIPLLHIVDPTAVGLRAREFSRVGLLATRFTMEQDFYRGRLETHGLEILTPDLADRDIVHRIIFEELCLGVTDPASRAEYLRIIGDLRAQGAEAVILGCTEIGLLIGSQDTDMPLFDTTALHAEAAVEMALQG
ncbi:MAG: aspartate/glutamate racemase family protein [Asticcacaulis sp.]|nr:aspartate/glutamate racemase family protein [Asticcacaulis sp.]